ncbi:STAS domain-containing protein [Lentzea chajnantorensis]
MTHARRDGISDLTIETVDHDGVLVVALNGDIDITNASQVRTALEEQLNTHPVGIVVWLAVGFLASTGLSTLGEASRRAQQAGVGFAVVAAAHSARRSLLVAGMDSVLLVHESVPHAVEALRTAAVAERTDLAH